MLIIKQKNTKRITFSSFPSAQWSTMATLSAAGMTYNGYIFTIMKKKRKKKKTNPALAERKSNLPNMVSKKTVTWNLTQYDASFTLSIVGKDDE